MQKQTQISVNVGSGEDEHAATALHTHAHMLPTVMLGGISCSRQCCPISQTLFCGLGLRLEVGNSEGVRLFADSYS